MVGRVHGYPRGEGGGENKKLGLAGKCPPSVGLDAVALSFLLTPPCLALCNGNGFDSVVVSL